MSLVAKLDLTKLAEENFFSRFSQLAVVNILSNIMVPLSGLISIAFLGHLREIHYLAGVAVTAVLFGYIYRLLNFLRMGTTGVTAQAVGRNDREAVLLIGLRNGLIALCLGMAIVILQHPLRELWFTLLSATPDVEASGADYFNARIWGAPAFAVNLVLVGLLLGMEKGNRVLLMAIVGNIAKIALDYLYIVQWHWGSTGAGLSACISQYLTLLVGIVWLRQEIHLREIVPLAQKIWNLPAFKVIFTFNRDLLIRLLASRANLVLFTNFSAAIGTTILAGNTLMIEIFLLSFACMEGVGFAIETFAGNFKGKGKYDRLVPLAAIAVVTSFLIGLAFGLAALFFPQAIFGLLTNHADLIEQIKIYTPWLLPVLAFISIAYALDGYFFGLADGKTPRNSALMGTLVGFMPLGIIAAWYFNNNHLLWFALSVSMAIRAIVVSLQMPKTLNRLRYFSSDLNMTEEG